MKEISTREFQRHQSDYMSELPIILTRYNEPVAIVRPIKGDWQKDVYIPPKKEIEKRRKELKKLIEEGKMNE